MSMDQPEQCMIKNPYLTDGVEIRVSDKIPGTRPKRDWLRNDNPPGFPRQTGEYTPIFWDYQDIEKSTNILIPSLDETKSNKRRNGCPGSPPPPNRPVSRYTQRSEIGIEIETRPSVIFPNPYSSYEPFPTICPGIPVVGKGKQVHMLPNYKPAQTQKRSLEGELESGSAKIRFWDFSELEEHDIPECMKKDTATGGVSSDEEETAMEVPETTETTETTGTTGTRCLSVTTGNSVELPFSVIGINERCHDELLHQIKVDVVSGMSMYDKESSWKDLMELEFMNELTGEVIESKEESPKWPQWPPHGPKEQHIYEIFHKERVHIFDKNLAALNMSSWDESEEYFDV